MRWNDYFVMILAFLVSPPPAQVHTLTTEVLQAQALSILTLHEAEGKLHLDYIWITRR